MSYSLKEAAEATDKSKPTILRAIQKGKISATKDAHGEWQIDPAELHRVYEPATSIVASNDAEPSDGTMRNGWNVSESEMLRDKVALLHEMLADREKRVADKDAVIDDLRQRLDQADEERRRATSQLTALLTDQRAKPEVVPPKPRRWWSFGRG